MNLKSITASWIIALCLLGLVSLFNQPAATEEASHEHLFMLPEEESTDNETQVIDQIIEMEARIPLSTRCLAHCKTTILTGQLDYQRIAGIRNAT